MIPPEILADGYSVSAYALRCGAVQSSERLGATGWRVELYREHDCYHVRGFDYAKRDKGAPLDAWRTWQSFTLGELAKARAAAFRMLRAFGWHDVRHKERGRGYWNCAGAPNRLPGRACAVCGFRSHQRGQR